VLITWAGDFVFVNELVTFNADALNDRKLVLVIPLLPLRR